MCEKEQEFFVNKQATHRLPVHKYTATATNMTSQLFSIRESSNFCLKAIITAVVSSAMNTDTRSELRKSSPASRPSSSSRRDRSASASSPATVTASFNPDQWEGKIFLFAPSLRCALTNNSTN